jgi:hypothetical protein
MEGPLGFGTRIGIRIGVGVGKVGGGWVELGG